MRSPKYFDGTDVDGNPASPEPYRKPFIHGSEADVGEFKPISLGGALSNVLERCHATHSIGDNTESPIELQLGAALIMYFKRSDVPLKLCLELPADAPDGLFLVPQFKWSHYRSDWAIINPKQGGALLLECDGRDFHSSADQIAHDRKKDAAAADRGYLTMRFTGSEIHKDADGCAKSIFNLIFAGADCENLQR